MIKAVFFDVGNTLFFYNYEFLRDLLGERFGIDVSLDELEATHSIIRTSLGAMAKEGKKHEEIVFEAYWRWFRSIGIDDNKIQPIIDAILGHPFRHLFWAKMEDSSLSLINWFSDRGYKLGVISNAEGQIKRLIEHVGLESKFETIVDSHDIGFQKPDERIFLKALADLKVNAQESVHVGDLFETDVVGARSVGMLPILVDRYNRYPDADCLKVKYVGELKNLPIFN